MYEFTPFKKSDKLQFSSFIQFPRELLEREEYKILNPNAMLLFSVLSDRLDLSLRDRQKFTQYYLCWKNYRNDWRWKNNKI